LDDSFYKNTNIIEGTSNVNLKEITELTLASLDFDLRLETELAKKEFLQSCQNFKSILEVFRISTKDEFMSTKDFKGNQLIIYSKNKHLYKAECYNVGRIIIGKRDNRCYNDIIQVRLYSNTNEDILGYLNSEGIISGRRPEVTDCDFTNARIFYTGGETVIRKMGLYNSIMNKESVEQNPLKFAYNIQVENRVNHNDIFNESFNVLREINNQIERDEEKFKSSINSKKLNEIRQTISGILNWTDNYLIMIYILGGTVLVVGSLLFFGILINCGISPCQCMGYCFMGLIKGITCCFTFYCCNKKFRNVPNVTYNRSDNSALINIPSAPSISISKNIRNKSTSHEDGLKEFHKFLIK
jgi:hypothetical protein